MNPIDTRPARPEASSAMSSSARATSPRTVRACSANRAPASVSSTRRVVRVKQGDAELALELLDLLGEGGLRDVQPRGRPAEVPLLGEHGERPEVTQFHASQLINPV